jgi:hypothetical protein
MLTAVGHAVVVNPDAELLRIARERGWDVLRLDPLRGRLRLGAVLAGVAALGSAAGALMSRRAAQAEREAQDRPRRPLPRRPVARR